VDILYFAWVRERIGTEREAIELPPDVTDVRGLIAWLARRSPGHASALSDPARLRAAVDQQFVSSDAPVVGAKEVAIFPPVTGG
jgi:molybdopterin synthase sulfur carrier subunit